MLAKKGIDLKIMEFSDYVVPNQALDAGELDANSFQHQPYLDNQVKDRGYKIVSVATTVNFPMGIYSKKHKSFGPDPERRHGGDPERPDQWRAHAAAAAGQGRDQAEGRRRLQADRRSTSSRTRSKLKFIEIDAAQAPRTLDDVDAAAVNTNYAEPAGLSPQRTRSCGRIPRDPTSTSSRFGPPTRTSPGSRTWSRPTARRR